MDTFLNSILNISVMLGLLALTVLLYIRARTKLWIRVSFVSLFFMYAFASAIGESWYYQNHSLLWLFGLEQYFLPRTDWGPIFFLMLVALALIVVIYFAAKAWTKSEKLPGTPAPYLAVAVILCVSLYFVACAGSYANKAKGYWLGSTVLNATCLSVSEGFYNAQDLTGEIADQTSKGMVDRKTGGQRQNTGNGRGR